MNAPLFPEISVNGEAIPATRIAAEAQNHPAPKDKPGLAWRAAARALAVRALLLQEARRRGLSAEPEALGEGQCETEEEALIRALVEAEAPVPAEAEVRAEWARDPSRFRSAPLWEVSHILCACDPQDDAAKAAALSRAKALAARLLADPAGFARLASAESDCGSRSAGGALGQLGPGDTVPEFEAALRRLAEDEVTAEPVLTRHGWHLIRLDALAERRELPYEVVHPRLAEALEKVAWARAARDLVARLVAAADVHGVDLGAPGGLTE